VAVASARSVLAAARDAAHDATQAARAATGAERSLSDTLAAVYRDPGAARAALDDAAREAGPERAAAMLRSAPVMYGALQTTLVTERRMLVPSTREDDRVARAGAELAADLVGRSYAARAQAPTAEQLTGLLRAVDRAHVQAVRAEADLARLPNGDALARSVARGVARLDDRAFAELKAAAPTARADLADAFRDAGVQALVRDTAGRVQQLREEWADRTGRSAPDAGRPSMEQQARTSALHARTAAALLEGRAVERALAPAGAIPHAPGRGAEAQVTESERSRIVPSSPLRSAPSRPDVGRAGQGSEANVARGQESHAGAARASGERTPATPRERTAAADAAGRAVQQAIQSLTPDELHALVTAVRAGAHIVAQMTGAGVAARSPVQDGLRRGVAAALSGREATRDVER
jgi:hypothetical protein